MDISSSVGSKLRVIRQQRDFSQRDLAERAGVSTNAVSLIERDEISPSVATLQRLATALDVKMSYFFDTTTETNVVHTPAGAGPKIISGGVTIESLGARLHGQLIEPFHLTLAPHAVCGEQHVVHLGQELVYCVRGCIEYDLDGTRYLLQPGDFLLFYADLPHCWRNPTEETAEIVLVLQAPQPLSAAERHFLSHPSIVRMK
jgi:XRE family transcriptional regulator, regulator of sulfur utilization